MTRINTNVSSLNAQKSLAISNASLQQALTRLSTGLRINVGKDDPAGLIASEMLRSDIVSTERAIANSQRANQIIATADSALGQVSSLLNDIRGLVTEAANEGALSAEQIAANQLQVDSSLEAINRIAQMTTFQGRKLLDGSLDFVATGATAASLDTVADMQIDQANLGATGSIAVDVDIATAATRATITSSGFSAAATATATLSFAASDETAAVTSGAQFTITATSLGTAESGVDIVIADGGAIGQGNETAVYAAGTLTITIDSANTDAVDVVNAINNQVSEFSAVQSDGGAGTLAVVAADAGTIGTTGVDSLAITAATTGADYNNVSISVTTSSGVPVGTPTAVYDSTQNTILITIHDDDITTLAAVNTAVNNLAEFNSAATTGGSASVDGRTVDPTATANTDTTGGNVLLGDLVASIGGTDGSEVFSFQTGASINQIVAAINLVSDATGLTATQSAGTLTLTSTAYGSNALALVDVISEGTGGMFETNLSASRANGTDIVATVNGVAATGDGNELSINTATLDLSVTVAAGSSTNFDFTIASGGALFQLGPDVVSNQQARLGIQSVNSASLGGVSGRLYQIGTGESAALDTDPTTAGRIVDEVITKVTSLRGRLGAFQRTTLDTNIATLNDTLENLTAAESSIRDADFAAESAALTRAQILVQSGVSVLAIANTNPQNILALLR